MVAIARENTDRLVRLVNDTLDLERLEAGRVDVDPRLATAAELLAATAQIVQPLADEAGVELSWEAPEIDLLVDPDRIVQALINLVANAVKFSPAGATVRTVVEVHEGEAVLSVADDGRGIPADKLDSIFERFRQVDTSDRREKGGTGLGLSISRAIVEQHGGRIWAESEPGSGATFRFTLPLHRHAPAVAVYDRRGHRRDELARAVRRHGRRVVAFATPEALAAASETFAAVFVAGASGFEDVMPGARVFSVLGTDDARAARRRTARRARRGRE